MGVYVLGKPSSTWPSISMSAMQSPSTGIFVSDGAVVATAQNTAKDGYELFSSNGLHGSAVLSGITNMMPYPELQSDSPANCVATGGSWCGNIVGRHSGGANNIFFDGHVKWLSIQQLSGLDYAKNYPYFTSDGS